ncbi:hypothetical protein SAMN05216299_105103 [Nitrosospira sp. Nsp14]|nr:hypothetical protein SAMN05216299_105103 [Nitrosospira sp. Nsp14]
MVYDEHVSDDGKNTHCQLNFLFAKPHSGSFLGRGEYLLRNSSSVLTSRTPDFFENVTFRACLR